MNNSTSFRISGLFSKAWWFQSKVPRGRGACVAPLRGGETVQLLSMEPLFVEKSQLTNGKFNIIP